MKKLKTSLLLFLLLCCCSLLTSCFDFVEEVNLNSNGSGTIKATLNLSKSSSKVASLLKLKSVNGIQIPSEEKIKTETADVIRMLKQTEGISEVKYSLDFKNYIATVSCNYTSINVLNTFSAAISKHFKSTLGDNNSYAYNAKTGVFTKSQPPTTAIRKRFEKLDKADRAYFDEAYYTQIIRFDKAVKSQQHAAAKVSSSAKSVLLKLKVTDLISGKNTLANTITLK